MSDPIQFPGSTPTCPNCSSGAETCDCAANAGVAPAPAPKTELTADEVKKLFDATGLRSLEAVRELVRSIPVLAALRGMPKDCAIRVEDLNEAARKACPDEAAVVSSILGFILSNATGQHVEVGSYTTEDGREALVCTIGKPASEQGQQELPLESVDTQKA